MPEDPPEDPIAGGGEPDRRPTPTIEALLLFGSVALTGAGGVLHAVGLTGPGDAAWAVTAVIGAIAATAWAVDAARQGRVGVDIVSIMALGGSLLVHELLAGAVIAVMLASGRTLEARPDRLPSPFRPQPEGQHLEPHERGLLGEVIDGHVAGCEHREAVVAAGSGGSARHRRAGLRAEATTSNPNDVVSVQAVARTQRSLLGRTNRPSGSRRRFR